MKRHILLFVLAAAFCVSAVPNTTFACGIQGMDRECPVPTPTPIATPPPAPNQSSDGIVSAKAEAVIVPKSRWFLEYFFDLFR